MSTVTALLAIAHDFLNHLEVGKEISAIFFDFCKAFDKVPHQPLIDKLGNLGLGNHTIQWITSYLTKRKQRVVLNGEISETASVLSGVQQGSVFGPLLFLRYACGWGYESSHFWRQSISSICRRYLALLANFTSGRLCIVATSYRQY